jgi:hypothetical protein
MMAAAQTLPDVQSAVLEDTTTVGVLFKDGTTLIIDTLPLNDNTVMASATGSSTSAQKLTQPRPRDATLPTSRTAYLIDAGGLDWSEANLPSPPTDAAQPWFQSAGYATVSGAGSFLDFGIQDASALMLDAHGGFGAISPNYKSNYQGKKVFGISTNLPVTDDAISQLTDIIQDGEVGYYDWVAFRKDPVTGKVSWNINTTFYITPEYVRKRMSFDPNSILFMNICTLMSNDPAAQDMVQAFFDVNAGAILGWDTIANAQLSVDSALYFFDRVLGAGASPSGGYGAYASQYDKTPPNRPFSVGAVYLEMGSVEHSYTLDFQEQLGISTAVKLNQTIMPTGWGADPTTGDAIPLGPALVANLLLKISPKSTSSIALVPTISTVTLQNNKQQLILTGDFGSSSTNKSVTIDSVPMNATWTSGSITVTSLPDTASGNVQVTIDGAKSNQVLINQWNNVPLTMVTGPQTVTCNVNLRTSFDALRQAPDQAPTTAAITTDNVVLPNGQCSFVSTDPAGGGDLPWFNAFAPGAPSFPDTGANVWSTASSSDGRGGGTVDLSIQASYNGGSFNFLETSATKGTGQNLVFDDAAQGLAAGSSTQYGPGSAVLDTFEWGSTSAAWTPLTATQPQAVQPHPH